MTFNLCLWGLTVLVVQNKAGALGVGLSKTMGTSDLFNAELSFLPGRENRGERTKSRRQKDKALSLL